MKNCRLSSILSPCKAQCKRNPIIHYSISALSVQSISRQESINRPSRHTHRLVNLAFQLILFKKLIVIRPKGALARSATFPPSSSFTKLILRLRPDTPSGLFVAFEQACSRVQHKCQMLNNGLLTYWLEQKKDSRNARTGADGRGPLKREAKHRLAWSEKPNTEREF